MRESKKEGENGTKIEVEDEKKENKNKEKKHRSKLLVQRIMAHHVHSIFLLCAR